MQDFLADGPFLVVYSDNVFDFDLQKLLTAHAESAAIATLALFDPHVHAHTGVAGGRVEMDRSGRILRFVEGEVDPALRLVNAGCYVIEPSLLRHIPEGVPSSFGRDLFPMVLRNQGILCGHLIDGFCFGVDTPEALARAQRFFAGDRSC
jgi:NDP-sugar pyrophosphorylase family protein